MSPSKKAGKKTTPVRKAAIKAEPATAVLDMMPAQSSLKVEPRAGQQQEGRYVYGVIESRTPVGFG
ncbi:MAG TPA: hypothetical protein VGP65_15495, partial [Candidatus Angelobacter sp.]|nr:hypothetical protein [Candidatus Angelobacter sp.]